MEATPNPNGNGKLRTTVEVTGQYLLAPIDDSNERWSNPEWVTFAVTRAMCLLMLVGGMFILMQPKVDSDLRLMVTILTPAAGFKLIEGAGAASNKRGQQQQTSAKK